MHALTSIQMLLPNKVRWMEAAGYLQINSSMSLKSSLPRRPVLSPFSAGTEKARLASTPFPGSSACPIASQPQPG